MRPDSLAGRAALYVDYSDSVPRTSNRPALAGTKIGGNSIYGFTH
eukprot:COSAG03_NODE_17017_length_386_cov_0.724739_1_plen_44_part_01